MAEQAVDELRTILRRMRSAVVAFSGGVDSAALLAIAVHELHDHVLAVTGRSPSVASGEAELASRVGRTLRCAHEFIDTREFDDPRYRVNPRNRCFYCKDELYARLAEIARARGFDFVADGCNADDGSSTTDVRPGRAAALAREVRSPLAEAGIGKAGTRAIAKQYGLEVWDKPATPCLSSRIPYGTRVEIDDLRKVDLAEQYLRARGFRLVRVRHFGSMARIEVPISDISRLRVSRYEICSALKSVGYERVEIDERGYRTGSLNE